MAHNNDNYTLGNPQNENSNEIIEIVTIINCNSKHLFELLAVCKQWLFQQMAAMIFWYKTKSIICLHFNDILKKLNNSFVHQYLGYTQFTNDNITENNVQYIFKQLFSNVICIVCVTYLYCQKSKTFKL